jgi:hypothetical protein
VVITESLSTGVNEVASAELSLFPVPAQDHLIVNGLKAQNQPVRILDATGRLVLRTSLSTERLAIGELPTGAYVLQIITSEGPVQRTFTKE